ncbi:hypothetical protein FQ154_16105 [Paeniglutamicibacter gangotriensis]|uniref:Uncharacterized protein n=1 Tax=Paeniglutamicibacter gangotriensis TaxID=254787 RepID=A0A5B0E7N0_9MICC|nr:hypothetical protein [Paeniglutamicibacter gangotriensis]KAA0974165.1 hypothetical protein FQ154_16105 [Paeniglutamicibacter gangotriensis]
MKRRFAMDPVTDARVFADKAEQMAKEVRRTMAAVETIADCVRVVCDVVSPLVERLKTKTGLPAGQDSVSTK